MQPHSKRLLKLFLAAAALLFLLSPLMIDVKKIDKGKIAARTLQGVAAALERYKTDVGAYPGSDAGLEGLLKNIGESEGWKGPYLKRKELPRDPWGKPFQYETENPEESYRLYSLGADGQPGGSGEAADIQASSETTP